VVAIRTAVEILAGAYVWPDWLSPQLSAELNRIGEEEVRIRYAIQHGDLHGGNLLVGANGHPILIDFGRTGESIAGWDAAALELSLLFHPDRPDIAWPTRDHVAHFMNFPAYVASCPYGTSLERLRQWGYEASGSERSFAAVSLAYCRWQAGFATVDHERLEGVVNALVEVLRPRV
jgi:hypothetical protein